MTTLLETLVETPETQDAAGGAEIPKPNVAVYRGRSGEYSSLAQVYEDFKDYMNTVVEDARPKTGGGTPFPERQFILTRTELERMGAVLLQDPYKLIHGGRFVRLYFDAPRFELYAHLFTICVNKEAGAAVDFTVILSGIKPTRKGL